MIEPCFGRWSQQEQSCPFCCWGGLALLLRESLVGIPMYIRPKPWVIYYKHRACMGECRFQWGRDVGVELTWMPFPPHNVWLCNFFSLIIRMKTNLEFWLPWLRRICHLMKQLGLLKNWNPGVQPGIYFCKRHMLRLGQRQKRNSHSMPKETGYSSSKFKDQRVCRKSLRFVVCLLFLGRKCQGGLL